MYRVLCATLDAKFRDVLFSSGNLPYSSGAMMKLVRDLLLTSELSIRKDSRGVWSISARGVPALLTLIVLLVLWHGWK